MLLLVLMRPAPNFFHLKTVFKIQSTQEYIWYFHAYFVVFVFEIYVFVCVLYI